MSHWNYRIMRHRITEEGSAGVIDEYVQIHTVYYDDDGKISWSDEAMEVAAANVAELGRDLELMARAISQPILDHETGLVIE